jgi:Lrp/AsnC family leucine-responsive transcriptional regulator
MDRIDDIDARIIELLQENGRMRRNKIAEEVGLSLPSVSDRMRKLEERGIIQSYHAVVNAKKLHVDITAFIRVNVDGSMHYQDVVEAACRLEGVMEVHSITGEGSHMLKVRTRNTTTLERLLSAIQSIPGVHSTSSSIVLSTFKESHALPIRTLVAQPTTL